MSIPIVDMQEQEQATAFDMYRIRSVEDALSFSKDIIGYDQDESAFIYALDRDKRPVYVHTTEKQALWDHQYLVDIYKNVILSNALGVITACLQGDRLTEIDQRDIEWFYGLCRLGHGLGIQPIDYIFFNDTCYISFMMNDLIPSADQSEMTGKEPFL